MTADEFEELFKEFRKNESLAFGLFGARFEDITRSALKALTDKYELVLKKETQ